jgi:outer membrane protein OmpA-like peptidoglycan-associated protein
VTVQEIVPASTGNADGRVTIKVSGGTGPYAHDGGPIGLNATHIISRLAPGKNRLRVIDANGCQVDTDVDITENILPLSVTIQQNKPIPCAGQADAELEALPRGGKSPYTYTWSNGASGAIASGLKAGSYALTITDAAGQSSSVTYNVKEPEALRVSVINLRPASNDRINDGKATVEAKGGFGAYRIEWSSGETATAATKLPLGAGTVRVTDGNGCVAEASFTIAEKVMPELTAARLSSGEPIRMEKIQFEADSVNLNEEAIPSLDELFGFLYDNPTIAIEVSGHTNSLPADDYCDRISAERATTVAKYLTDKGIDARRIVAKGYGKRKPIATNQTPEGRRRNQRVEIRLIQINE